MSTHRKYKIAVFGSARENLDGEVYKIAEETGVEIAKTGNILVTGAAQGVSRYAAEGAKLEGGSVIGISPTLNDSEKETYNVSFENIDYIIHTGMGYKGRNVISVRTCDGMIIINGNFGTLSEIAIGEGEMKPIVAIEGTGCCAEVIEDIFKKLNPEYQYFSTAKTAREAVNEVVKLIEISKDKKS